MSQGVAMENYPRYFSWCGNRDLIQGLRSYHYDTNPVSDLCLIDKQLLHIFVE